MPHALIENQTLVFDGEHAHYGDFFRKCRLELTVTGNPKFVHCVFMDCEFTPPLPDNLDLWQHGKMYSCVIDWTGNLTP